MADEEYRASKSNQDFCRLTTVVAPSLRPVLLEHLEDNFDEMLPHIYFGDVSRWVTDTVSGRTELSEVTDLLLLLDATYPGAHEDVQNLIDVSFVENVQDEPEVVELFGPNLMARVDPEYRPE